MSAFWFKTEHVEKEVAILSTFNQFVESLSDDDIEACVDSYLSYQFENGPLTASAQFVARVHLLHPHDFKQHQTLFGIFQTDIEDLQKIPIEFSTPSLAFKDHKKFELKEWLTKACIRHKAFLEHST